MWNTSINSRNLSRQEETSRSAETEASEENPLIADDGGAETPGAAIKGMASLDVKDLIAHAVGIRLPRIGVNGKESWPPRPRKKAPAPGEKRPRSQRSRVCSCPPTLSDIQSWFLKYFLDICVQAIYAGVAIFIFMQAHHHLLDEYCIDSPSFIDEHNNTCAFWAEGQCRNLSDSLGFSEKGVDYLLGNCSLSCGTCTDVLLVWCDDTNSTNGTTQLGSCVTRTTTTPGNGTGLNGTPVNGTAVSGTGLNLSSLWQWYDDLPGDSDAATELDDTSVNRKRNDRFLKALPWIVLTTTTVTTTSVPPPWLPTFTTTTTMTYVAINITNPYDYDEHDEDIIVEQATLQPTSAPTTAEPTAAPTAEPTTAAPTAGPTTVAPTAEPTFAPTETTVRPDFSEYILITTVTTTTTTTSQLTTTTTTSEARWACMARRNVSAQKATHGKSDDDYYDDSSHSLAKGGRKLQVENGTSNATGQNSSNSTVQETYMEKIACLVVNFVVEGVDYSKLAWSYDTVTYTEDASLKEKFGSAIIDAIRSQVALFDIHNISVGLYPGSVQVDAAISPEDPKDLEELDGAISSALLGGGLTDAIISSISNISGIEEVQTGPISVSYEDMTEEIPPNMSPLDFILDLMLDIQESLVMTFDLMVFGPRTIKQGAAKKTVPGLRQLAVWTVFVGAAASFLLIYLMVTRVGNFVFPQIEKLHTKVDQGIRLLLDEIQTDLEEIIEDAGDEQGKEAVAKYMATPLKTCIKEAQKELRLSNMIPFHLKKKSNFVLLMSPVPVLVTLLKCGFSIYVNKESLFPVAESEAGRRLDAAELAEAQDELLPLEVLMVSMISNVLLNMVWGFMCSFPMILFIANHGMKMITDRVNDFLLEQVIEHIPGGVEKLQKGVNGKRAPPEEPSFLGSFVPSFLS